MTFNESKVIDLAMNLTKGKWYAVANSMEVLERDFCTDSMVCVKYAFPDNGENPLDTNGNSWGYWYPASEFGNVVSYEFVDDKWIGAKVKGKADGKEHVLNAVYPNRENQGICPKVRIDGKWITMSELCYGYDGLDGFQVGVTLVDDCGKKPDDGYGVWHKGNPDTYGDYLITFDDGERKWLEIAEYTKDGWFGILPKMKFTVKVLGWTELPEMCDGHWEKGKEDVL